MIVAGFGFRRTVTVSSLSDALSRVGITAKPTHFATAEAKASCPAFQEFATAKGVKVLAIGAANLKAQTTITQSSNSLAAHGTGSVAEAAALAAIGPKAELLSPRVISADSKATCAIATGALP